MLSSKSIIIKNKDIYKKKNGAGNNQINNTLNPNISNTDNRIQHQQRQRRQRQQRQRHQHPHQHQP